MQQMITVAPIFKYVQEAPLEPGEKRGDIDKEEDRRMGDKQRSQAKLSALLETASKRVETRRAQKIVDKCTKKSGRERRGKDNTPL
jgi:hypothetical protein